MALLRSIQSDSEPCITGERVYMRPPRMGDFEEWAALRATSRDFLTPWEPTWPADDLTRSAFRRRLRRYSRDMREDLAYPFFIFREGDDALLGGVTLSNVRRGVTQSCSLGYWIGEPHARSGYMTDAVRSLTRYVFEVLRLHRLEAACLPTNEASKGVLLKSGFTEEGYARQYLRINGAWRDHVTFAILENDIRR